MSERVMVVPAELVAGAARGRTFWSDGAAADEALAVAFNAAARFAPRAEVETDETVRQVIPYLLLRSAEIGRAHV